jgi:hypothetical protein
MTSSEIRYDVMMMIDDSIQKNVLDQVARDNKQSCH